LIEDAIDLSYEFVVRFLQPFPELGKLEFIEKSH
jgi:hypothetical protein